MTRGGRLAGPVAVAALALSCTAAGAEELLYYVDNGSLVITNTPSRPDARPLRPRRGPDAARGPHLPRSQYDPMIESVAADHGLSARLLKVVALVESNLDPLAVSPKGAVGLMQLMPATARRYDVRNATDPYENLRAGARHLRGLLDEFGGDLSLALAAYNAGSGAVRRHGGVPAYPETIEYVRRVHARLRPRERAGRAPRARETATEVRTVELRSADGRLLLVN